MKPDDRAATTYKILLPMKRKPGMSVEAFRDYYENHHWRDAGGTHGTAPSMNKGLGKAIDAHIEYLAEVDRLVDKG